MRRKHIKQVNHIHQEVNNNTMKNKTCGCKSMRSGGKCMKCGGTATYRLGGVIQYFTDGGEIKTEDKSLPNWGRAKTQQEILNKLIKEDKSIEKSGALVEDDIIGPKTIEAMRKYEANGSYKRPVLFSDENLAQYKKNVEGMNKTKDTEKKSTLVNPTSVTQQQVAKTPVTTDSNSLDSGRASSGGGERDNALRMKLDRIKSANTKDDIIKLGKELGMEEEEQSPVMRALQYKTSILHSDIASATNDGKPNSGNNSSEKIIAGIKNSVKGDDKSILSYVLGESPDFSYSNPTSVTQQQVAKTPVTKVTKDSNVDKAKTPVTKVTKDSNADKAKTPYIYPTTDIYDNHYKAVVGHNSSPNLMSGVRLDHAENEKYKFEKSNPTYYPDAQKETTKDDLDWILRTNAKEEAEAKAKAKTPVTKGSKNSNLLEVFNPIGRGMKSILSGFGEGAEYAFNTVNNFAQNLSKPANYNAPKEGSMSPSFKESTKPQGTDKQQRSASLYQDKLNSFRERGMNDLTIEEKNLAKDLSEYTKGKPETAAMKKWLNDYEKD